MLTSQAVIYSESFIEYGLLAFGSGLLFGSADPEDAIEKLQNDLFAELGDRCDHDILDIVREIHRGTVYNVETARNPITPKDHEALLTVVLAMAGLLAREQGAELELMLDYIQVNLLSRAAEGEADF